MKPLIGGGRYCPKGYPAEVEQRVQYLRRQGVPLPSRCLLRTPIQLEGIRAAAAINTALLDYLSPRIREGMSTAEIDHMVYAFTTDHGALPAPLLYEGYPRSVCVSVNEVVCHGIPNPHQMLQAGDIVNVDVSTFYMGYYADASRMYLIGQVDPDRERLVRVARQCRDAGVQAVKPYGRLGDIGAAIQRLAEAEGFSVVTDFCGHGCGRAFHEDPDVDHVGTPGTGLVLLPGMTFTIEPMLNMGRPEVEVDERDGWTVRTLDRLPSAQWESQVLVTCEGVEVLTQ